MVIAAGSTPTSLASAALTLPMLPDAGTFTRHIRLDVRTRTVMVAIVVDGHSKLHWEPSSWVPAAREWHAREATPGSSGRVAVEARTSGKHGNWHVDVRAWMEAYPALV